MSRKKYKSLSASLHRIAPGVLCSDFEDFPRRFEAEMIESAGLPEEGVVSIVWCFPQRDGTQIANNHGGERNIESAPQVLAERSKLMAQTYTLQFIHRLNDDGTIDSICSDCFVTVATATSSSALEREERKHCCDPVLLERYKKVRVA